MYQTVQMFFCYSNRKTHKNFKFEVQIELFTELSSYIQKIRWHLKTLGLASCG